MTSREEFFEQAKIFLPKYLTPTQQKQLFEELDLLPNLTNFYLSSSEFPREMLQGDCWKGFVLINFDTLDRKTVSGIVLSNSCDIDQNNTRKVPTNILFSPIIPLSKYIKTLHRNSMSTQAIDSTMVELRRQHLTKIFYLPKHPGSIEESIIVLDNIHTHPAGNFLSVSNSKVFTLSQHAFYLFLMKLSIHFCRFQEEVRRFDGVGRASN